jgi:hypothetical protein
MSDVPEEEVSEDEKVVDMLRGVGAIPPDKTEQETFEKSQLYIPEAKLDPNVKRMAWLLFLEWWKDEVRDHGMSLTMKAEKTFTAYEICVSAAKLVWHEQEKGYERH